MKQNFTFFKIKWIIPLYLKILENNLKLYLKLNILLWNFLIGCSTFHWWCHLWWIWRWAKFHRTRVSFWAHQPRRITPSWIPHCANRELHQGLYYKGAKVCDGSLPSLKNTPSILPEMFFIQCFTILVANLMTSLLS